MRKEDPKEKYKSFKAFAKVSGLALELVTTILIGVVLGSYLDRKFDKDFFTIIGIIVFTLLACYNFFRTLTRL
ncbi:MAG: AtpZ/AtpI family protein [Bacilli bacterium]|jgi:F0F1-type ATP synthase assembly protein I|nr:AtpZ/AtpI family protein [Bacilli bacterium]MDD4056535.1 AtpZ/AtpI family protein [Bacilli bacterium]MDY0208857.1 AtpZ/AtpI family protein [Bacilli bacterium]